MAAPVAPARTNPSGRLIVALVLLLLALVCLVVFTILGATLVKHHQAVEFGWLGGALILWALSVIVRLWP